MRALTLLALLGLATVQAAPEPLLAPSGLMYLGPFEGPGAAPSQGKERVRVDPETGALHIQATVLRVPVAGPDLQVTQVYVNGAWAWSFQDSLRSEGQSVLREVAGQTQVFTPDEETRRQRLESGAFGPWMPGSSLGEGRLRREEAGWRLQVDGAVHHYDLQGRLTRIEDPSGSTRVSWDELGRPSKLEAGGAILRLFFDGEGQLSVLSGASGQETYVQYEDGQLVGLSGQDRPRTRYFYDKAGRLERVLWSDGSRLRVAYDEQGRVTGLAGPGTWSQRYIWTERGLNIQDGLGLTHSLVRGAGGPSVEDPSGHSVSLRIEEGQLMGWVDPAGLELRLRRDAAGRITQIEGPGGTRYRLSYSAGALSTITDAMGNTTSATRGPQGWVTSVSDAAGHRRAFSRSPQGQLQAIGPQAHPTRFSRDTEGRITKLHWPTGAVSRLSYDSAGRLQTLSDPGGQEILIRSRDKGRIQELISRGGARWLFTYDRVGRLRALLEPKGTEWRLDRDPTGRLRTLTRDGDTVLSLGWRVSGMLSSVGDALGGTWGLPQNPKGLPRGLVEPDGSTTTFAWDPRGELVQIQDQRLRRDPRGLPTSAGPHSWRWDAAGQLTEAQGAGVDVRLDRQAGGAVRQLGIGEQQLQVSRDASGWVVGLSDGTQSVRIQRNGQSDWVGLEDGDHTVTLERDDRGLVVVRGIDGREQRLLHDSEGRVVRYTAPDGRTLSVARHPDGSPQMLRFPDGRILRIEEGEDLWAQVLEDPSGSPELDQRIRLNPLGWETAREVNSSQGYSERTQHHDPRGQVVAVEEASAAWFWAPDAVTRTDGGVLMLDQQGQAASLSGADGAHGLGESLQYQRDSAGCLQALLGEGGRSELTLDGLGRLQTLRGPEGQWTLGWSLLGDLQSIQSPSGQHWELVWALGELVQVTRGGTAIDVLGNASLGWVWLDGAQSLGLMVDREGTPQLVLGAAAPLQWTPLGLGTASSVPLGPHGAWRLGPQSFLVDRYGAWDPHSGARLCSLAPPAFPDEPERWAWDPAPWMPQGPWADPLALLVALGELEPWVPEPWAVVTSPAGVLPSWPESTGAPAGPLLPPEHALPLDLSPLETLLLRAVRPPVTAVDPQEILKVMISSEYQDQAVFHTPIGDRIPVPTPAL